MGKSAYRWGGRGIVLLAVIGLGVGCDSEPAAPGGGDDTSGSADGTADVRSDGASSDVADDTSAADTPPVGDTLDDADDGAVADVGPDDVDDAGVDTGADAHLDGDDAAPDVPVDPCDPAAPGSERTVVLPLGETLFFDGDDYLAFWGKDHPCEVALSETPEGAEATMLGGEDTPTRLTPDVAGAWTLTRGPDVVHVQVDADYLTPDTFMNFNYTPVHPLALVEPDEGSAEIWVASPPSNAVHRVVLGAEGPQPAELVPTGAWPTSVAVWEAAGLLVVAQTGRDTLGFVDLEKRRVVDAIRVGNEPASVILDEGTDGGAIAYVTLSGEDRVARVDLEAGQVTDTVDVGRDPRAMDLDPATGRLYVASLISGNLHPQGPIQGELLDPKTQRDVAVIDTATFEVVGWAHEVGTILRGSRLVADGTRLLVGVSHSHNTALMVDASTHPISHALAIVDTDPESETAYEVLEEIDLDHQDSSTGPAASPFTVAPTPDGSRLIVTLSAGQALLVLDPTTYEELERIPTGSDPRGLVFAEGRMWTYAWLDNQLQGWLLPSSPGADLAPVSAPVGDDPTPLEVKQGQRMFNDATFSGFDEFSCNNCHLDGLTDGLVWDLLLDGPVNTLAFRNVGGTSPFLWGGQLPTLFDFSREVLKLVGAEASGAQMQLLTTYMQSVTAPPNPYTEPGGRLTAEAKMGAEIFHDTVANGGGDCSFCHSGQLLTNRKLVEGKTPGVMTDVPSLFNAYDTAPYGREGQWETLEEMVAFAAEFTGAELTEDQLAAVTAYVRQQPADRLYPTATKPLNDSEHIWYQTPIELTFSAVLLPGQEEHFTIHREVPASDEDGEASYEPVAGAWSVSGRFARFAPEGELALETRYVIDVAGDLEGSLGPVMPQPLEVTFETGGLPAFDVSGEWDVTLCEYDAFNFCATASMALVQSTGGQVTGVVLDNFEEGAIDHLEGVTDGTVLALDPFTVESAFGPIPVANGVVVNMVDEDEDGYAEHGIGETVLEFGGDEYEIEFEFVRTGFPQEFD